MTSAHQAYLDALKAYRIAQRESDNRYYEAMCAYEIWVAEDDDDD